MEFSRWAASPDSGASRGLSGWRSSCGPPSGHAYWTSFEPGPEPSGRAVPASTRGKPLDRGCPPGGPFVLGLVLVSVAASPQDRPTAREDRKEPRPPAVPERLVIPGVENAYRLSPRLYSGGDPHGAEALAALKELGIRTLISVDGATPDVEAARKLGLRYVHLPIGYDGVPREQAVKLVKAMKTLPGPVYVHCHHGKHRGPAAAAVCGLATEGWTEEQALAWMERAGTSPDYRGLYTSAREFVRPSAEELERAGTELPERAKVPALAELMVQVDERWDHLKAVQKSGFKVPPTGRTSTRRMRPSSSPSNSGNC